jgi:succinyl-CoA synthetase alpha subunit
MPWPPPGRYEHHFVPPAFVLADAIMEAADAGNRVIITITEGIPTKDMIAVKQHLGAPLGTDDKPNSPGNMTAGECKVGHAGPPSRRGNPSASCPNRAL